MAVILDEIEPMRALLRGMNDMIVVLSADGELLEAAVNHPELTRPKHVRHFLGTMSVVHRRALLRTYLRASAGKAVKRTEVRYESKSGQSVWLEATFVPLQASSGGSECMAVAFRDVTERKAEEERLRELAFHDALTGLPNRRLFMEHMKLAVNHAKRHNGIMALLHIDIDDFKRVNDTYGHEAGDELLRTFAQRLRRCIREVDTFARIGGDEFTILLPVVDSLAGVSVVAQRLYKAMQKPIDVSGSPQTVGISMGIAVFPQHGTDQTTLIKNADTALYEVKRLGKNGFRYYRGEEPES